MMLNLFNRLLLRAFPVPKFLKTYSFGLDISDESLKFIGLTETKYGVRVGSHGETKIPPGIIEAGKIKNPEKFIEILKKFREDAKVKSVRISLPEQQMYLFQLFMEKAGLVNIRESIELMLEEHIPIKAENAVFDYEIISEDENGLELQVLAIPRDVIENYLFVFKSAEIAVQSFELEAQAIYRAVIKKGDPDTYMIVDFGEKRTGIFIASGGVVMFTSTLDFGGAMLNEMIAKNFGVSLEEGERMKKKYGLQRNTENKEFFSVLLNGVSILRDELVKHFLYWHTHKNERGKNNPPIKKIILSGGDSNLIGLSEYISISMKSVAQMADVWVNIVKTDDYIPDINFKEALSFATALGLALRDLEHGTFF